jgi:hypothetical protein
MSPLRLARGALRSEAGAGFEATVRHDVFWKEELDES